MRPVVVKFFMIFLLLSIQKVSWSQPSENLNVIAPSPNAASLCKFVETPVGYYTGIPKINIPLLTISAGSYTLPISMSYHAGGIKVAEVAPWVGLGWALNAGGVITRIINGIADEIPENGFWAFRYPKSTNQDYRKHSVKYLINSPGRWATLWKHFVFFALS